MGNMFDCYGSKRNHHMQMQKQKNCNSEHWSQYFPIKMELTHVLTSWELGCHLCLEYFRTSSTPQICRARFFLLPASLCHGLHQSYSTGKGLLRDTWSFPHLFQRYIKCLFEGHLLLTQYHQLVFDKHKSTFNWRWN